MTAVSTKAGPPAGPRGPAPEPKRPALAAPKKEAAAQQQRKTPDYDKGVDPDDIIPMDDDQEFEDF